MKQSRTTALDSLKSIMRKRIGQMSLDIEAARRQIEVATSRKAMLTKHQAMMLADLHYRINIYQELLVVIEELEKKYR